MASIASWFSPSSSRGAKKEKKGKKAVPMEEDSMKNLKRLREASDDESSTSSGSSIATPKLVYKRVETGNDHQVEHEDRPIKRFRGERVVVAVSAPKPKKAEPKLQAGLLGALPEDVLSHCLSFLNTAEDRFSLQTTCKQFRKVSNSDKMLVNIKVGGDQDTGKNGIIQEEDSPESAAVALAPFSQAGNLEAIYMLGMIKSYCHQDVERGILLLKKASSDGYVRSSYALGLVLRDSKPMEATQYMKLAAGEGYLPALQELLPAREMKAKYGEPNADELRRHLDPICLNRLLGRHYVHSAELRELNTSHCWNPLCGRWAFKASVSSNSAATAGRIRRPWGYSIFRNGNGGGEAAATGASSGTAHHHHHHHHHNHNDNSTAETRVDSSGTSDESSSSQSSISQNSDGSSASTASCVDIRVSRMKMCSRCCRAKYCSKLCQVYDWRSSRHKMECQFL